MPKIQSPALNWAGHRARWAGCQRCPLGAARTKLVLARGSIPCDVLLIGEAPGPSEDVIGVPFVGPAGQLLDWQLAQAQLQAGSQLRLAFTNLVSCIPFDDDKRKFAEPPKQAVEACRERLKEFIKLAKPRGLVAVGKLSEKQFPALWGLDDPMLAITHPAAILRMGVEQRGLANQQTIILLSDYFGELQGASNDR